MKQTLVISCPASSRSGYGDHSRDLVRSLIAMNKYDIKVLDQRWGACPRTALASDDEITQLIDKGQLTQQPDIWMQVTVPNEFQKVGKFNIGITAGIETDRVSVEWIQGMNNMDINIVPSHHSKLVFEQTTYDQKNEAGDVVSTVKCNTPIHVLFEGLDIDIFDKNEDASFEGIDHIPESFCFLTVGHWLAGNFGHDRKDLAGTMQTFIQTFKGSPQKTKPALLMKTSSATFSVTDRESILQKVKMVKAQCGVPLDQQPNIYVIHGDLTEAEMNGLYNHNKVKAMLSLTHGEGFGRPLLEFSVTGKPTIATNWSGHVDFLGNYTFKIPGKLDKVDPSAQQEGIIVNDSSWFFADYGYASKVLKDMYKKYKDFLAISRKQRKYVKDNFSMATMRADFAIILEQNVPEPVKLKLPKLKLPKLKLPKLEKVNE